VAHRTKLLAAIATCAAFAVPLAARADQPGQIALAVQLVSQAVGNTAHDYLQVTSTDRFLSATHNVPPRRSSQYCLWSDWTLIRLNAVSHERTYGVSIYDGCNHDTQVFPVPTDIRQGSCNNDDGLYPSSKFSVCPIIAPGHVPAGLPFDRRCEALTEANTSLLVDITPQTYDSAQPATLTVTTHFSSDMTQVLSEGTCSDVLDWQAVAWTLRWSDGTVDHLPASGRSGITATHTLQPAANGGTQQSDLTVVARLHVAGQALDFDQSGNPVVRNVDGYVDVSNHGGATGAGSAPVDVPPQLTAGAIPAGQQGDGTLPPPDTTAPPAQRAVTLRGRVLALYPRAIVARPGVELVDGVEVGQATTTVTGWRYEGTATDAPAAEGTHPGAHGGPDMPVVVQYDHAERTDAAGRPVDEMIPLTILVRTTYPDGAVLDSTVSGDIAVAIWYAGLTMTG
jgi:hypothetical protein